MPYWRLFYHIVWSTKNRIQMIDPAWESNLYGYIWGKATALECIPHAIGGVSDHLHIAISIPPKLAVAAVIGQLKGASSHFVNERFFSENTFRWQAEYGVMSVSERALPKIVEYINNQKTHHAENRLNVNLEDFGTPNSPGGEPPGS
jgi:putative transposase